MNFADMLSCTRVASWSDKRFHRQRLDTALVAQGVTSIKKAYLLGFAAVNPRNMVRIGSCVERKSAWCLRQVFEDLPYAENELGLTVVGPMCAVYLLIKPPNRMFIAVIDSSNTLPLSPALLLFTGATGFPYWLIFGKRLIVE